MDSKNMKKDKGKILYSSVETNRKVTGDEVNIVEKTVSHYEKNLYAKYYIKKNGKISKIEITAPGTGGEYTLSVKKDDQDKKVTKHTKKEILDFIKKQGKDLEFMLDYIGKTRTLSRASSKKSKSKKASKSKTKKGKTSKTKKGKTSKTKKGKTSKTKKGKTSKTKKSQTSKTKKGKTSKTKKGKKSKTLSRSKSKGKKTESKGKKSKGKKSKGKKSKGKKSKGKKSKK
jgi:hypothetical protein